MIYKRLDSSNSGFSMIELLVSLVILAIGLLAVVSMQGTAMTGNNMSRSMTKAYHVGQSQIASLLEQDYASLDDNSTTRNYHDVNYTINWQVTEDVYIEDMKTIDMTVSWSRKGETKSLQLTRSVPQIL